MNQNDIFATFKWRNCLYGDVPSIKPKVTCFIWSLFLTKFCLSLLPWSWAPPTLCVRCTCMCVAGMWISMWVWYITGWLQMYSFIQLLPFNHCVYLCKGLFTFCCLLSRHVCRQMCLQRDQWATHSLQQVLSNMMTLTRHSSMFE